ncbi:MAG: ArsR/SmtB family transcription factor [Halobacteriales archaeon]
MSILERKEKLKEKARGKSKSEEETADEEETESNPEVLTIDDEKTDEVLSSVSSETAREILTSVHDSPKIPIDLADELGTTTQNVRYHLDNLEEAGLVEVCDICYSEKGREMSVYEPSDSPSMLVFGRETDGPRMRKVLTKVSSSVGPAAIAVVVAAKAKFVFEWLSDI